MFPKSCLSHLHVIALLLQTVVNISKQKWQLTYECASTTGSQKTEEIIAAIAFCTTPNDFYSLAYCHLRATRLPSLLQFITNSEYTQAREKNHNHITIAQVIIVSLLYKTYMSFLTVIEPQVKTKINGKTIGSF